MEEKEVFSYKEIISQGSQHRSKSGAQNGNEDRNLSSGSSDEWWEKSQSICSSCCDLHSISSFEWEKEINENGQLFYVKSDVNRFNESSEEKETKKLENDLSEEKNENLKKGKLLNWVRRKDSKRLHQKPLTFESSEVKNSVSKSLEDEKLFEDIVIKVNSIGNGETLSEKLLGFSLNFFKHHLGIVEKVIPDGPACAKLKTGDIIHKLNGNILTAHNFDSILHSFNIPCDVILTIEKTKESSMEDNNNFQSQFVQSLFKRNKNLDDIFFNQPVGVVVVDVESQNLNKDDVIYCYPEKCVLSSCRGAFVTLYHLLAEIRPNDCCQSSSVVIKDKPTHIMYRSDENYLLLIAIPQSKCTLKEATLIMENLIRNICFTHQTMKQYFETNDKLVLDHFFSLFFCRILLNGFSANSKEFAFLDETSLKFQENGISQFEDIMPYAAWVPLPKEAQIQIDEALNELEANDFDEEEENCIENQRIFNILGSALFHKGYLLSSHLPKDDLLDVLAYFRQNCLIQLMHNEPVKSLIAWREVFPFSVNRGLHHEKPSQYFNPSGRWFLLTVGQKHDLLAAILEAGENCAKIEGNPGPPIPYVEEVEDTLKHMQKLGISTLASQWLESNCRFRTVTPEEIFSKLANHKKDNLLGFAKTSDGNSSVQTKTSPANWKLSDTTSGKKIRSFNQDTLEDSLSQTHSNVSELSDDKAPILGRKADKGKITNENLSCDSDSSDSDWDSSRDSNMIDSYCSSTMENFYFCDVNDVLPARLTTGPEDILFHYVQMDGNEGVLINSFFNSQRPSLKMKEILENFRKCSQIIHSILQNNVKLKNNCLDNSKCVINKSLIAVKEHGLLFECFSSDSDSGKKPTSFTYWIVGRLFFTPQPREIYVCYHDEAPQNLVEFAFRLSLSLAG